MEKIYKIIKIIDDETLVINAGYDNGIKIGDDFEIFEDGEEIKDPDTGEVLGTLDTIKERVEAIDVFPKMCICRHNIIVNYIKAITGDFTKIKSKTLNIDSSQISGGLSDNLTIHIGDKVRKIRKMS